jgi:predicted DNA-binding transcriptional regulator YafY
MRSQKKSARDDPRNAQLLRLLALIRELDRMDGVDLYELATRHGTSTRTIRRDLGALEAAGLPLVEERDGKRMRWRIAYRDALQKVAGLLDASHYLGLKVAMDQAGTARRAPGLFSALEDLAHKIEDAVGETGRAELAAIEGCFHSFEKFAYASSPPEVIWPLVQAIAGRRLCRVTYRAARAEAQAKSYRLLPLKLFCHQGAVYLWCRVLPHEDVTTLNLQRLTGLEVLAERGEPPRGFDPERLEASTFGVFTGGEPTTFRLRFAREAAPYIREKVWHPSQKLRALRDGRLELTFTCADSPEVTSWVASWRELVEVVEPASLRAALGELGTWLARTYRS